MKITKAELKQIIREEASAMNVVLDLVGLIPGIGPVADLANALDYTRKGDYLFAGLSVISMLPVIGDVIGTGGKVGVWLAKAFPKGSKMVSKYGPEVLETIKELQVAIIANEKLIDELFDALEESGQFEDLTEHLPRIREALHVFSGKRMSDDEPEEAEEIAEGTKQMKITKSQLKKIVAEELGKSLGEGIAGPPLWPAEIFDDGEIELEEFRNTLEDFAGMASIDSRFQIFEEALRTLDEIIAEASAEEDPEYENVDFTHPEVAIAE